MFLVVPERVTVLPNVTAVALALIVRFVFCLPGLGGGLAATAGPAQTNARASAAPNFFIAQKRSTAAQVDAKKRGARRRLFVSSSRRPAPSNSPHWSREWSATCIRTPLRRRRGCQAPSCAGPR